MTFGVGLGAQVGGIGANVGVNLNPGCLFSFVGAGLNAGLNAGAGLAGSLGGGAGLGAGVGVNGGSGGSCPDCQANGGAGAGVGAGLGVNGGLGAGGSGNGGAGLGAGVGINGGGDTGGGVGAGVGANGSGDTGGGAGAGISAGLGGGPGAQAGAGVGGNESSPVNGRPLPSGPGAGQGFGTGYGVSLVPVPVVPISASAGLGGQGGAGVGASVGAQPNGTPQCTVQGGPARMIYFPPTGGQAAGAEGQAPGAPAPVGGSAITTLGQTFQPGSAYISCETLWAGYTNDQGSVVQSGPTFTNAIFPVPSDQISTQCQSTLTAYETAQNTQAWGAPQQCDFNNVGASPTTCMHVAPPPNLLNQIPEFAPYLFWNMSFQEPQYYSQEGSPAPAQGSAWGGPSECGCTPSVVAQTTNIVPTTPVAQPSPAAPAPTTGPTQAPVGTTQAPENSPAYTGPQASGGNGTSPTGISPYTGEATLPKAGKSSFAVAALLLSVLVL